MTISKTVYDGTNGYTESRGQVDTLEGDRLKEQKFRASLFHRRNYLENDYKAKILKGEMVEDEEAVVLQVTDPTGKTSKEYYSLKSGLLLKTVSQEEGSQGNKSTVTQRYLDYEDYNGVKFPNVLELDSRMSIKLEQEKIDINGGIEEKAFKL